MTLKKLSQRHRVVGGDIVGTADVRGRACQLLIKARQDGGTYDPKGLAAYVDHPGARWGKAGVIRAETLFGLAPESPETRDPKKAIAQLTETLEAFPGEAGAVRRLMGNYVERFGKDGYGRALVDEYSTVDEAAAAQVCADRDEYAWLHKGVWKQPELAEPIATTDGLADEWLLACADAKASVEATWGEARTMYDTYLEEYADQPSATKAKKGRDQVVALIRHKEQRQSAIARAGRPTDGSNLGACADATCQVRVRVGDVISMRGRSAPYQLLINNISGGSVDVSLGGFITSMSSTGGSMISGDGYASWAGAVENELVLNDKVGFGVDGISGSSATLSVFRAP